MLAVSIRRQLEEVLADETGNKNLSGNIASSESMFSPGAFDFLEKRFDAFAFIAFHPDVDTSVRDYVQGATLSSDSGPRILAMFILGVDASSPVAVTSESFGDWIDIEPTIHPSYQIIRFLFEPNQVPPLPGIVIFRALVRKGVPLYVPLSGLDVDGVRSRCREIFSIVDSAATATKDLLPKDLAQNVAIELRKERIEFESAAPSSPREWLIRSYQVIGDNFGDIVSAVSLFA